jgi:phage terminase small subunit
LTAKQKRFVEEYMIDVDATKAAIRAGYKKKAANKVGPRLLTNPHVVAAIQIAAADLSARVGIKQEEMVRDLYEIKERCLQHKQVFDRNGQPVMVEGPDGTLHALFAYDATGATKALELIGKHIGMWPNKVNLNVTKSHEDWLDELASETEAGDKKPDGTTLQ